MRAWSVACLRLRKHTIFPNGLTPEEVVNSILASLKDKPLEVILPPMRGVIAKVANAFPTLAANQLKKIQQQGLKRQQKIKQGQDSTIK